MFAAMRMKASSQHALCSFRRSQNALFKAEAAAFDLLIGRVKLELGTAKHEKHKVKLRARRLRKLRDMINAGKPTLAQADVNDKELELTENKMNFLRNCIQDLKKYLQKAKRRRSKLTKGSWSKAVRSGQYLVDFSKMGLAKVLDQCKEEEA